MDKDNIIAGLGEIHAFCETAQQINPDVPDICKRWAEVTSEAMSLLEQNEIMESIRELIKR